MPMGGLGQRFVDAGYETPKPLIKIDGKEMFLTALSSFDLINIPKRYIFVVRKDQDIKYGLVSKIKKILPGSEIVMLDKNTRGAVETAMLAKSYLNNTDPIVILDCDMKFTSKQYFKKILQSLEDGNPDGLLLTFNSRDARYSYAKTKGSKVIETAEKRVISSNAIAGAYYFRTVKIFTSAAEQLLTRPISKELKEYYVSSLFNILINEGGSVEVARIDSLNSFGTPEELDIYRGNT